MSATITFDTFKFVERLEKAGVPREHAAAIVSAQRESLAEVMDATLATKTDIAEVHEDFAEAHKELAVIKGEIVLTECSASSSPSPSPISPNSISEQ